MDAQFEDEQHPTSELETSGQRVKPAAARRAPKHASADDDAMTIVDPLIDKASKATDDADVVEDLEDSELEGQYFDSELLQGEPLRRERSERSDLKAQSDLQAQSDLEELDEDDLETDDLDAADPDPEDIQFDRLDDFMSDDPDDVDEFDDLADADLSSADLAEAELALATEEGELDTPLTASQQALEARRAIEERAEQRRMERDLNYLDFELDD